MLIHSVDLQIYRVCCSPVLPLGSAFPRRCLFDTSMNFRSIQLKLQRIPRCRNPCQSVSLLVITLDGRLEAEVDLGGWPLSYIQRQHLNIKTTVSTKTLYQSQKSAQLHDRSKKVSMLMESGLKHNSDPFILSGSGCLDWLSTNIDRIYIDHALAFLDDGSSCRRCSGKYTSIWWPAIL